MGNRQADSSIAKLVWIGCSNSVAFGLSLDAVCWCVERAEFAAFSAALTKLSLVFCRLALEHRGAEVSGIMRAQVSGIKSAGSEIEVAEMPLIHAKQATT